MSEVMPNATKNRIKKMGELSRKKVGKTEKIEEKQ
jgi:hypothetical protein